MESPILVTGGTGTLGSHVVRGLMERGHHVRVLSRNQREGRDGVERVVGDLIKRIGIDDAVDGVDVIVHCASARSGDLSATRNLISAAVTHGRKPHLVYISVVGASAVPFGYIQTKLATEHIVEDAALPWTIQRATQFYDFVLNGAENLSRFPVIPVPRQFLCQPIDPAEVADRLIDLALGPPSARVPDIGGPDVTTWGDMTRQYLHTIGRKRVVVEVPLPKMREIRKGCLLVQESGPYGTTTWQEFLAERLS